MTAIELSDLEIGAIERALFLYIRDKPDPDVNYERMKMLRQTFSSHNKGLFEWAYATKQ